jgi:hypothetical protein
LNVRIERHETSDHGTFGKLVAEGFSCFTGELPDRENRAAVSCIPPRRFGCVWTFSPTFKRFMYLITGVPGRSGVRIHSANLMGDKSLGFKAQLQGCIALGERLGTMDGQKALLLSAPAVRRFEMFMAGRPFELEIVGC